MILQFGANDNGGATREGRTRGTGEETSRKKDETVHTFGWYLQQFV